MKASSLPLSKISYKKVDLPARNIKRMKVFARFEDEFWWINLAHVDKLANFINGVNYFIFLHDLFDGHVETKKRKTMLPTKPLGPFDLWFYFIGLQWVWFLLHLHSCFQTKLWGVSRSFFRRIWIWRGKGRLHFRKNPNKQCTKILQRRCPFFQTRNIQVCQKIFNWIWAITLLSMITWKP